LSPFGDAQQSWAEKKEKPLGKRKKNVVYSTPHTTLIYFFPEGFAR
jgi:hypothetical protein